jgi:hypothetical protein
MTRITEQEDDIGYNAIHLYTFRPFFSSREVDDMLKHPFQHFRILVELSSAPIQFIMVSEPQGLRMKSHETHHKYKYNCDL